MKFIILSILVFVCACSTTRTRYKTYKKGEGYRDRQEDSFRLVNFTGNSYTTSEDAMVFAKFRAVELCLEEGKKLAHIMDVVDKTRKETVVRTNTYYPSYYYGMYPYYSRYSSMGIYTGFGTGSAWNETYVYPSFDVLFECRDKIYGPELIFRDVSAEEMKLLVKDLKGGLQVEKVLEHSVNKKRIEVGDIVLKGNGERLQKSYEVLLFFNKEPLRTSMKVNILREGEKKESEIRSQDITGSVEKGQAEIIHSACQYKEIKEKNQLCGR